MSLPAITECVGGYIYDWDEEHVHIEVSRLRGDSKGAVHGEVVIQTSAPGYAPHLHQAQFNFSSTASRKALGKNLTDQYQTRWTEILEQMCVHTLERFRKGEPVVELWTSDDVAPPEYLLDPLIIKNYPSIIFGDPSTAKSTVSIILSQIMQLPWADNPLGLAAPARPIRCLFLDWETDYETVRWQLTTLQRGMGLPALMLSYRSCALPLSQDVDQIRRHIIDTQSDLIIIDSLGLAAGGELKETGPALAFYTALRQLKTTALILAHTSKDRENKRKTVFGSVFFEAKARNIWEITKSQDHNDNELSIGLRHHKPPPFGKLCAPLGMRLVFGEGTMQVLETDPTNISEFAEKLGVQQRILIHLKGGPATPKELAEALEISDGHARKAIFELTKRGKVVKTTGGGYGLVSSVTE